MDGTGKRGAEIARVGYRPPSSYSLDLEVLSFLQLRRRVDAAHFRQPHRIEFHMLICVTRGRCTHFVDFVPLECRRGTLLVLRPSQTQQFQTEGDWDAAVVIFRPEFLLPLQSLAAVSDLRLVGEMERLPERLHLDRREYLAVTEGIARMHADSTSPGSSQSVHALLRHQLYALLLRIHLVHGRQDARRNLAPASALRFRRFQALVAAEFQRHRDVRAYASRLGCTEKTLTRCVQDVAGKSAKAYIAARVNLEAKRLLVHTALPIAQVAERLGFDEATNFVKFFRREVACTPGEFRSRYRECP